MSDASYQKINYALRPAKATERKMIVEALSRLRAFFTLESYRYIGFGSPYFSDFSLIHRSVGIQEMVCMEKKVSDTERFEFNRPFQCIELRFGTSNNILPTLDWEGRPTVLWLDYDGPIDASKLADLHVACSSLAPGSFLVISLRSRPDDFGVDPTSRLQELRLATGVVLPRHTRQDATNLGFGRLLWRIIDSQIRRVLSDRSAGLRNDLQLDYKQILHFEYRDGVKMLTVGGVIYGKNQRLHFAQCDFGSLPFYRTGDDVCRIKTPLLTFKELRALSEYLPGPIPSLATMPQKEVQAYAEHYRYFPNYIEAVEI